jgi:hypothetical protein
MPRCFATNALILLRLRGLQLSLAAWGRRRFEADRVPLKRFDNFALAATGRRSGRIVATQSASQAVNASCSSMREKC